MNARTTIAVDLFNYEGGGHRADGRFEFGPLADAFTPGRPPDLILINEAKFWARRGRTPLLEAARILSAALGRPYCAELGSGAMPAAIMYDPRLLCLETWNEDEFEDKKQLARFSVRRTGQRFLAIVDHWSPVDGDARLSRAKVCSPYGYRSEPVVFAGDFNCTAAGALLPETDWDRVPADIRPYKGLLRPDGTWGPDTRPLDYLIGGWDDVTGRRVVGRRWHALADLAYQMGTPAELAYRATVNEGINEGGATLNDWILINEQWHRSGGLVPGSYHVHIPPGSRRADYPSDHRRISAQLTLTA